MSDIGQAIRYVERSAQLLGHDLGEWRPGDGATIVATCTACGGVIKLVLPEGDFVGNASPILREKCWGRPRGRRDGE